VPEQRFVENQVGQVGHDDHFVGYFLGMFWHFVVLFSFLQPLNINKLLLVNFCELEIEQLNLFNFNPKTLQHTQIA